MFGLTPYERNDLWNPFREFEKDFFKDFSSVNRCRTDIRDEDGNIFWNVKCPVLIRRT